MKQIFSWTIGSFFRTIGRTLALLGMGALLYFILSRLGVGINDLFFDNVKASTITYSGGVGYQGLTGVGNGYQYFTMNESSNMQMKDIPITLSNNRNGNELRIPFLVSGELKKTISITHSNASYVCTEWKQYSNGNWYCYIWDSENEYDNIASDYELNLNVMLGYYDGGNGGIACTIDMGGNTIICPLFNSTNISYNHIYIYYTYKATGANQTINFNLAGSVTILQSDEYIIQQGINSNTNAINNQTQQQQQNHEQIMDTNSTATDQKADSFFNDSAFEDTGGLSSIITAPLTMINSMLNNSYSMPCATWKGAQICLPGGDMLWSRPGASDLKNLLNVFYGGVVCYYAIRKLFLMIERMKDPTSDNIEVTDL